MGTLLLFQIGLDLGLIAIITILLMERSKAKNQDDPRLSRGLQMLTSKIAIVQDLMDRSETSGKQLTQLLEAKQQDVHETLEEVERQLHRVYASIEKSKDIARLFEDKIPHEEIIERQNAEKYLTAAKLANQGFSVDEISRKCDIPRGELDLIVKLNRSGSMPRNESAWIENQVAAVAPMVTTPPVVATPEIEKPVENSIKADDFVVQSIIEAPVVSKTTIYSTRFGRHEQDSPTIKPVVFKRINLDPK